MLSLSILPNIFNLCLKIYSSHFTTPPSASKGWLSGVAQVGSLILWLSFRIKEWQKSMAWEFILPCWIYRDWLDSISLYIPIHLSYEFSGNSFCPLSQSMKVPHLSKGTTLSLVWLKSSVYNNIVIITLVKHSLNDSASTCCL